MSIWEAPSQEEEKLLALEARFAELKKKLANKRKGLDLEDGALTKKSKKTRGKGGESNSGSGKKEKLEKPAWMFQRPADSELRKPREWNGTEWWYCSKETGGKCEPGQYRAHKPPTCKGTARKGGRDRGKKSKSEKKVVIKEAVTELQGGYDSS